MNGNGWRGEKETRTCLHAGSNAESELMECRVCRSVAGRHRR